MTPDEQLAAELRYAAFEAEDDSRTSGVEMMTPTQFAEWFIANRRAEAGADHGGHHADRPKSDRTKRRHRALYQAGLEPRGPGRPRSGEEVPPDLGIGIRGRYRET